MQTDWLILIVSLPTHHSAGRMRVWRALKGLGCSVLRDGVYLLPYRDEFRQTLQLHADQVAQGGGHAHVLTLDAENPRQQQTFEKLFDRSADYAKLVDEIRELASQNSLSENRTSLQKRLQHLRKEFEAIVLQDFFSGAAQEQAVTALEDLEHAVHQYLAIGEPHAIQRRIKLLARNEYQNRIWATRQRPWIDRLASTWLIRRFIDPAARFLWLAKPGACPDDAVGFDFDGAAFTHVGAKVTFEVLVASFGLTNDAALDRIGALVHYLDVGGIPVLDAPGFETLIKGMHQRWTNDDELILETAKIFDTYYQVYSGSS
ncbi:MAG: hypothetical protein HOP23_15315 [Methylococcaceae bacterium]|nr:hypothetical protein [Methylococcaceae bacterium]